MVCVKSEAKSNSLSISFNRRSRWSVRVNLVGSLLDRSDRVSSIVREGFRLIVGSGLHSKFWANN